MCGFQPTVMKRDGKTFYSQEFEAAKMLGSSAPGHNPVDSLDTVHNPLLHLEKYFETC